MVDIPRLQTERLILREWQEQDRAAFANLNADPEVMRHFPALLSRAESDALLERIQQHFARHGYSLWAVEVRGDTGLTGASETSPADSSPCIGFTGLHTADFAAPFTPAVEIGWRLAREAQGHGYATEAARAVLAFAFERLRLPEIVSFTSVQNAASRRVMEKIGLRHNPADDFEHPGLPPGHPLREHVLYRLDNSLPVE